MRSDFSLNSKASVRYARKVLRSIIAILHGEGDDRRVDTRVEAGEKEKERRKTSASAKPAQYLLYLLYIRHKWLRKADSDSPRGLNLFFYLERY